MYLSDYYSLDEVLNILKREFNNNELKLIDVIDLILDLKVDVYIDLYTGGNISDLLTARNFNPSIASKSIPLKKDDVSLSYFLEDDPEDILYPHYVGNYFFSQGGNPRTIIFRDKKRDLFIIDGMFKINHLFYIEDDRENAIYFKFNGVSTSGEIIIDIGEKHINEEVSEIKTLIADTINIDFKENIKLSVENSYISLQELKRIAEHLNKRTVSILDLQLDDKQQPTEEVTQLQKNNQELKAQIEELQAELKKKKDQSSVDILPTLKCGDSY